MKYIASIRFTLLLIGLSVGWVMAATFLESWSGSHLFAATWSYHHPLFHLLLAGYFLNILTSALSRWPFKKRHIPFLITHLGLLMLIAGVVVKNRWGVQGDLSLMEGTGTDQLMLPHTQELMVRERNVEYGIPLNALPHKEIILEGYIPHVDTRFALWVKGRVAVVQGVQVPMQRWEGQLPREGLAAYRTANVDEILAKVKNRKSENLLLLVIQDEETEEEIFVASGLKGQYCEQWFDRDHLQSYVAYDRGYGGYFVAAGDFETPLSLQIEQAPPPLQKEKQTPLILIKVGDEEIPLPYDRWATGLAWPNKTGKYLLRFQPRHQTLPFRIRLKCAEKITYDRSSQAADFRCELYIRNEKVTLSMNQVHETQDGYRLYLANISPDDPGQVKRVHLIINRDPAKYILTYPGGTLVAIGGIGLLWMRRKQRAAK